ncbi:ATP-binding protein [Candidatus Omnitrophota bacterium]
MSGFFEFLSMLQAAPFAPILILISLVAPFCLFILFLISQSKTETIHQQKATLKKLKKSFEDLDEQAKLIVKTDLELNKAQEELDRRLHSLEALQKISRLISTTLDENEMFARLEKTLLTDIGFEKNLLLTFKEDGTLSTRINLGVIDSDAETIAKDLTRDETFLNDLKKGLSFSSLTAPQGRKEALKIIFNVDHFIVSPVLSQDGILGILFVGNRSRALTITEGDAEMLSILANQIGQAFGNAKLFEEVFRSRKGLENKIHERTNQLEKALKEVQIISKTKSEFVSAVSHELRTPLTSIKGFAAILIAGKLGEVPEGVKLRLEKINNQSDNLVKFINNLLDISRIESGHIEMNLGLCSLLEIIEATRDLLSPQLKEKQINWDVSAAESLPKVNVDRSQYERIFINLVSNAIKFTPENGTISVSIVNNDDILEIIVTDTGIGISQEDIDRLFDEFYRVENDINQNVKGTGLGLALVKKIIEAHKGKIWITSVVGEGTSFHFTLPLNLSN